MVTMVKWKVTSVVSGVMTEWLWWEPCSVGHAAEKSLSECGGEAGDCDSVQTVSSHRPGRSPHT